MKTMKELENQIDVLENIVANRDLIILSLEQSLKEELACSKERLENMNLLAKTISQCMADMNEVSNELSKIYRTLNNVL